MTNPEISPQRTPKPAERPTTTSAAGVTELRERRQGSSLEQQRHRHAALVAALLNVRPDDATARFDSEIRNALTQDRIDVETARTLRWWQRASVRAVEKYVAQVIPGAVVLRDEAAAQARHDVENAAASWREALHAAAESGALPSRAPRLEPERHHESWHEHEPVVELVAAKPERRALPDPTPPPGAPRLAVVRDINDRDAAAWHGRRLTTQQTRDAIRAALAPEQPRPT